MLGLSAVLACKPRPAKILAPPTKPNRNAPVPRKRYNPKLKAAFMATAKDARAAGKTWAAAFAAAKKAGYTGTLGGLKQMFMAAAGKKGKKAGKPGRPK